MMHKNMESMNNIFKKRVVILDGATGTQLQKLGMPQGVCPEKWCLENPQLIQKVHAEYSKSGADIIYSATFGANRIKLKQYGISDVKSINKQLARYAKKAVKDKCFVAGDIGPTGKFIEPFGSLGFEDAVNIFKEQVKGLLEGGVDIFVIETMMDIQEARAALIAVREISDKFTIVTLTYEKNGLTLNGTDPISALITLQSLGANAVGCNCSSGPLQMLNLIKKIKPYAKIPIVAKPNAGMPKLINGKTVFNMPAEEFGKIGKKLVSCGVNFLGGCCGTAPEHIFALKKQLAGLKPVLPLRDAISAVSSATAHVMLEGKSLPLVKVGECINPTGKKELQKQLKAGKLALVRTLAKQQADKGAKLLDVNVGVSNIDEKKTIVKVISCLAQITRLPLVIDSSKIEAVEQALRIYPGRALINSISAEKHKLKKLLPLAVKYGAMFILLPLTEQEVPKTFKRRKQIILKIFKTAKQYGCKKADVVVDGLILTVSSNPRAAIETMKTIRWAAGNFRVNTICGLSNISFGMPQRALLNATFRRILRKEGLSMVIDNPLHPLSRYNRYAEGVLLAKDKNSAEYVKYCKKLEGYPKINEKNTEKIKEDNPAKKVYNAILEGSREDIAVYVRHAIKKQIDPEKLVRESMIPAINHVGFLYEKKEYFLPQLIASAEAMKSAFFVLAPYLKQEKEKKVKQAVVVLATVKGDIHDIGKNIVALMLKNYGFKVIDLGKDVSSSKIIKAAKKYKAALIGLSALMTTTMVNMQEVIARAKKENLGCGFMVGGAVVNKSFANSIEAEYASNGVEAVRLAQKFITRGK